MTDSPLFCTLYNCWPCTECKHPPPAIVSFWSKGQSSSERWNSTCGSFSDKTGESAICSKLQSLLFNSLIFEVFLQIQKSQGFGISFGMVFLLVSFSFIWYGFLFSVLLLLSHWFLTLNKKEKCKVFCHSFPFSMPLCTFQNRSNICLVAKDKRNLYLFINSEVKQQKKGESKRISSKTKTVQKAKQKKILNFHCLLLAESSLLFFFLLYLL